MFRKAILGAALMVAGFATVANAGSIKTSAGPYQSGNGGEFTFKAINPDGWIDTSGYASSTSGFDGANSFQTFCIEAGENVTLGNTYNAQLSAYAMYGGVAPPGDEVSAGTGWLYSQFAQGTLAGYLFGGTAAQRQASASLLQNTIWWLEGETHSGGNSNIFGLAVLAQFGGSAANAMGGSAATYGVYAVNLWNGNDPTTNRAQDGLVYQRVPDGGATLALLGGALLAIGAARRRFAL